MTKPYYVRYPALAVNNRIRAVTCRALEYIHQRGEPETYPGEYFIEAAKLDAAYGETPQLPVLPEETLIIEKGDF